MTRSRGNKYGIQCYIFYVRSAIISQNQVQTHGGRRDEANFNHFTFFCGRKAAMVLCAYLAGFEKMIRIVSAIGPVIIVFTLMWGLQP